MSESALHCAAVYLLKAPKEGDSQKTAEPIVVGCFQTHTEKAKAGAKVIGNSPPGEPPKDDFVGAFRVTRSGDVQLVYGSDAAGLCE